MAERPALLERYPFMNNKIVATLLLGGLLATGGAAAGAGLHQTATAPALDPISADCGFDGEQQGDSVDATCVDETDTGDNKTDDDTDMDQTGDNKTGDDKDMGQTGDNKDGPDSQDDQDGQSGEQD